jgi:hypothetical protein
VLPYPSQNVHLTYNVAGRRVCKTVAGVSTYYLYDGYDLIAELSSERHHEFHYFHSKPGIVACY